MNEISKLRLFSQLGESSQKETNEEMQDAYGEFITYMKMISSGNDFTTTHRNLSMTRIEFAFLESIYRYELGEKCA